MAAPHETPLRIPSSRARRRAIAIDSSFETRSTRSTIARSRFFGTKFAPIPWILWGAGTSGCPARVCVMSGDTSGSTATLRIALPFVFLM